MPEFRRPESIDEALFEVARDRAVVLGGGTQIALLMKTGLLDADALVWIGRVPELRATRVDGDRLLVGAAVTLDELRRSPDVQRVHPSLAETASRIGNPRVRASATMGGHLVHADPRQDLPPLLLALGARLRIAGVGGSRDVPLSEFFTGFMSTGLRPGELVTAIELPAPPAGRRAAYARFAPNSSSDYPAVGVAAALTIRDGEVIEAVVALGAGSAWPRLVPAAGTAVLGRPSTAGIALAAEAVRSAAEPAEDQRGSADYKKAMAGLWTRRLLERLVGHARARSDG